ncbi:MAG TPA: DegT/DnrJ/EryC1/StrS aminotransferase family protein [bacterium]|nr:DegT/DnrJ/EryC1/StrS aminotransferase family protein [bacterium]HQL60717.1 DegT/DnrJ/EryC1/StrS aminotransferase family protein [bacterium]
MKREPYLVFGSPRIEEDEIAEVVDSLRSGWISTGPKVARFEEMFRDYIGCRFARATSSCTAGLHLAMVVAGVEPGDEVITTPLTFAATANAILHAGGKPVFVDIDPHTFNIDPKKIPEKITAQTRAIVPVHLAGRPCPMNPILEIAEPHNLLVIEDAAHAIEAQYHGRKIGTIGDLTVFSFYVTKNLTTGEGGMITTNRADWSEAIERFALHGLSRGAWKRFSDDGFKHYEVVVPGFKYNMMDIQAALGIHQLGKIEAYHKRREEIWRRYDEAFTSAPLDLSPLPEENTVHARHLYVVRLRLDELKINRDGVVEQLHRRGIGTGIHYRALHLHSYYRETFGLRPEDFPHATDYSERAFSLPLSAKLTDRDVEDVIAILTEVLEENRR